jgi:hypothetical protein
MYSSQPLPSAVVALPAAVRISDPTTNAVLICISIVGSLSLCLVCCCSPILFPLLHDGTSACHQITRYFAMPAVCRLPLFAPRPRADPVLPTGTDLFSCSPQRQATALSGLLALGLWRSNDVSAAVALLIAIGLPALVLALLFLGCLCRVCAEGEVSCFESDEYC